MVVPAFDPSASAVSGEESLREESELAAARALREELLGRPPVEAAALLRERIEATSSNAELLSS